MKVFQKFEPPKKVNENQKVFSPFPKMNQKDFDNMMALCLDTNYKDYNISTPEEIYERILAISYINDYDDQLEKGEYCDDIISNAGSHVVAGKNEEESSRQLGVNKNQSQVHLSSEQQNNSVYVDNNRIGISGLQMSQSQH